MPRPRNKRGHVRLYASLARSLFGYYLVFEAPDISTVRKHLAAYYSKLWCTVYSEDDFNTRVKGRFPIKVINEDDPIVLDHWQWE